MAVKIPAIIDTPLFLKFVAIYLKKFKYEDCGRWIHEYEEMENKGLLKPVIIRDQYKKMLTNQFRLGYIRGTLFWYVGVYATDAAKIYDMHPDKFTYSICVITGEVAVDDDGDEFTELSYEEAKQICKALNDEAEEELFIIKKEYENVKLESN